jgi:hypothetical protein
LYVLKIRGMAVLFEAQYISRTHVGSALTLAVGASST